VELRASPGGSAGADGDVDTCRASSRVAVAAIACGPTGGRVCIVVLRFY
jgi:hypothetical protein